MKILFGVFSFRMINNSRKLWTSFRRSRKFIEFGTVSTFNKSGTLKNTLQIVTNNKCYLKL